MPATTLPAELIRGLHDLFTRAHYSAASYVFDAQPYTEPEDASVLAALQRVREDDLRDAELLAQLLRHYDLVPEAGVFPFWHRDLNYLSVPYLANFVVETLVVDLARYDAVIADAPGDLRLVHRTLRVIREQRALRLDRLTPIAEEARVREAQRYAEDAAAVANVRNERLAQEKAAAEKARKSAQDAKKFSAAARALGLEDPGEDGISAKEKAKRTMLLKRAQKKAAEEKAAATTDPTAGMPDPNEPGISAKEKAKRTMLIKRAQKKAAEAAPPGGADPTAGMPDPNEPGIPAKEKAKRTMLIKRAQKKAAESGTQPAPGPAADPTAGMPDPDEPGISAKERAKRTMLIKRAQKKAQEGQSGA